MQYTLFAMGGDRDIVKTKNNSKCTHVRHIKSQYMQYTLFAMGGDREMLKHKNHSKCTHVRHI